MVLNDALTLLVKVMFGAGGPAEAREQVDLALRGTIEFGSCAARISAVLESQTHVVDTTGWPPPGADLLLASVADAFAEMDWVALYRLGDAYMHASISEEELVAAMSDGLSELGMTITGARVVGAVTYPPRASFFGGAIGDIELEGIRIPATEARHRPILSFEDGEWRLRGFEEDRVTR